ncbi:actin cytoskeleton-regulatory complex protein PAN1 [Biomphalaria pfeifferi]|uniref:Actin cytoskeleton-regulatory complex protein PAN1 n=1 Tax=Biomphalaria pfeifferi TaxID=112525 RepID=A0AAD8FER6_BIOPF|nr:actin cytoskeleton-regulatory complex protein PAN1 [Biomphalaria pfeifferi]
MAKTVCNVKNLPAQAFIRQTNLIAKYGLLRKKNLGINRKVWPVRFIVVSEGYLYCYKNENSEAPKNVFSLLDYCRVQVDAEKENLWSLSAPTHSDLEVLKVLYFSCLSDVERKEWVTAVNDEIHSIKNKQSCETALSESHYYDDIDEQAELSPGKLNGLNDLFKSPFKFLSHTVKGTKDNKRYHDLKLGHTQEDAQLNEDQGKVLSTAKVNLVSPSSVSSVPKGLVPLPPRRTGTTPPTLAQMRIPATPDNGPGPIPARIAKPTAALGGTPLSEPSSSTEETFSTLPAPSPSWRRRLPPPPPNSEESHLTTVGCIPNDSRKVEPAPPATEQTENIASSESTSPPIVPRLPPPRQLTTNKPKYDNGDHAERDNDDTPDSDYVNITDFYWSYEFPPPKKDSIRSLVDACLILDPNPNRSKLNSVLLSTGQFGTYFVRNSRSGGEQVLAYLSKTQKVNQLKIFEEDGKLSLDQENKSLLFDSLESLLNYYTLEGYLMETDEHLGRGIHEVINVQETLQANESAT